MPPDLGQRFAVVRQLGKGGQGAVWLSVDGQTGQQVAVKLLSRAGEPRLLRRELALLGRLRHPGLATMHDLGVAPDGGVFLVSEYVDAEPMSGWWPGRSMEELLPAVARLLGSLDFLHRRGVVHRDVKPANVLVRGETVKLVDFGLASAEGQDAELSGTPGFLAPEVLAGEAPMAAADLYAVGVMLHLFTTGRMPFEGDASLVIRSQLSREVTPPGGPLDELICQLLARDPVQRPATAAETLRQLEEAQGVSPGSVAAYLAGQGLPTPSLVGRDEQVELAEAALDAIHGEPGTRGLLVVGQEGEGATRFCTEVAVQAGARGWEVMWGLGHLVDTRQEPGVGELDTAGERARGIAQLCDGTAEVARERPLVVLLDNGLEELEVQAMEVLTRRQDLHLLFCATVRPNDETNLHRLEAFSRVELGALDERETAELVNSMLPSGWGSADLAAHVHRQSGGNPLLAAELTRVAAVARVERGAEGAMSAVLTASGGTLAGDLASTRVRCLSQAEARLAALISLLMDGLPLSRLSRLDTAAVDSLLHHGLLEQTRHHLRVAGRALASALLSRQTAEVRHELVQEALELVPDLAPRSRAMVLLQGALARADPRELLAGARDARQTLNLADAERLYTAAMNGLDPGERLRVIGELASVLQVMGRGKQALALLGTAAEEATGEYQLEAVCALAHAQLKAGAVEAGLATLEPLAHEAHGEVAALRGKLQLYAGQYEEALSALGGVAEAPEALHTRGLCCYYLGRLDEAHRVLDRAAHLARERGDVLTHTRVTNSTAMVHQRRAAFDEARACYQRCVEQARDLGHLPFEATFLMNLASVAQQTGDLPGALASYQQSLDTAQRFGGDQETAQVLHNMARLHALLGQPSRAAACLRRSLTLAGERGWTSLEAHNLLLRAEVALDRGASLEEVEGDLSAAEARFAELGDRAGQADVGVARARALVAADRPGHAVRVADCVLEGAGGMDSIRVHAHLVRGAAELSAPAGSGPVALGHLRQALRLAEDTGEEEPLVRIHHQLALAHAACGAEVEAGLHLYAAVRLLEAQADRLPAALRHAYLAAPERAAVLEVAGEKSTRERPGIRGQESTRERNNAIISLSASTREGGLEGGLDAGLLSALLQINKELNAEPDLRRLLERIIDHAVDLTGAERGFLLLTRDAASAEPLRIEVARNIDQETVRHKEFKISRSVAEEVLQTGAPLLTINAMEEDRFSEFLSVHNLRLRSIVCVPMTVRRQVRGAIYLDNRFQNRTFTRHHQELLSALADQAGLAVGNRELLEDNHLRQEALERSQQELRQVNHKLQQAMEQQSLRLDELARLTRTQQGELEGRYRFDNLVGQSAPMAELFRLMDRVRGATAPVYIFGESGTGKELVAKALHYNSSRSRAPFISVNCGAIPATLLESELFGYEKGAFTGADRQRKGLFERAHTGSLFLDEVGDMPAELQVRLLRVLQDRRFTRLGGEQEQGSDFRLLAASNKDLQQLVSDGTFREDLYYRINVIRLPLPPLRQRREDIPLLVKHLLERHGGAHILISSTALGLLMEYDWPGNVRELENEVLRVLALGGDEIQPQDLSVHIREAGRPGAPRAPSASTLKEAVRQVERQMATDALEQSGGSVTTAAARLGMSRVGLHKLLKRHGIKRS